MKTIALISIIVFSAISTNAQWNLGAQAGINKQMFVLDNRAGVPSIVRNVQTPATLIGSLYAVYETESRVNLGAGLTLKRNSVHTYLRGGNSPLGVNEFDIDHKSVFLSLHPIIDVSVDKTRFFYVLVNPNLSFLVGGNENGYRQYFSGEKEVYVNTSENIKKIALGISGQLQFRYPLTEQLKATLALGYSINNTVSKYLPEEKGNTFLQLGMNYSLSNIKRKNKSGEDKRKIEAAEN